MNILNNRYKAAFERNSHHEADGLQRYLFLDIDGVLNTMSYSNYLVDCEEDDCDEDGALFDPDAVANLASIIEAVPDVKIIISSTWRFKGWEWMNQLWEKRKLPGKIFSLTPGLEFVRFTDIINQKVSESVYPYGTRGLEISEWLRMNTLRGSMSYKYVILDDDNDFLNSQQNNLVLTEPVNGITKEIVDRCIEKLR